MRKAVALLLLALPLAGCASPSATLEPALAVPATPGVALACPEGPTQTRGDACVLRLADPLVQLSEPAVAVDPNDPRVIAVLAHAIGATGTPNLVDAHLFVTRDGGASWTRAKLPLPAPAGTSYSDPALAYAPDGTLHVSGMATHPAIAVRIFHAATRDDGRSWDGPTLVSPPGRWDRNWVSVSPEGRVFVSWHSPYRTSMVAWSDDGGASWTTAKPAPEGCHTGSPVAFVRGEPWLACSFAGKNITLHRVDVDAETLAPVAVAPLGCIAPRILTPPDGALLVTCYSPSVARSTDDGRSWRILDVAAMASFEDAWGPTQAYWSEVDARGILHMQISTFHRARPNALLDDTLRHLRGEERRIGYVALDPATGRLLHEARLTDDAPESRQAPPASLVPSLGDDWNGIAFHGNEGAMVWMNGGAVELTRIQPAP